MPAPDLSLVVPAYEEVAVLGATLDALVAWLDGESLAFEIIVCADGRDGTRELAAARAARDPRLRVLGGPERRGKGRAVREGVAVASGRAIGFVDADGKTPPAEIGKLLPWLEAGYDVVIASRAAPGAVVESPRPWPRRVASRTLAWLVRHLLRLPGVGDSQCGLKLFRGEVAHGLCARQTLDGYLFDLDLLLLASRAGLRIKEVGVRWRDDGDSRLFLTGIVRLLVDVVRLRLRH